MLHRTHCILYQLPPLLLVHLLDFMVEGKITEADALTICLDATPSGLSVPLSHLSPIFTPTVFSALPQPSQFIQLGTGTKYCWLA